MSRIGFLADDLTGASDVLARAHAEGLDAVLVLDPTRAAQVSGDVVGIAGPLRSMGVEELATAVRAGVRALLDRGDLDVLLYKVCSTFDSSPTVGSIGRALEVLHEVLPGHGAFPVVPAQPSFGRYTAFSHHFARAAGAGVEQVHRLDRHPVMAHHPSTPMRESDLRLVLTEQLADPPADLATGGPGLPSLHLPVYADPSGADFRRLWSRLRSSSAPAFVVDAVEETHLDVVAQTLAPGAEGLGAQWQGPEVVVGSGGIMAALARARRRHAQAETIAAAPPGRASGPVLAVSASASSTTNAQLQHAHAAGWASVAVPPEDLAAADRIAAGDPPAWLAEAMTHLERGRHVAVHTTLGPGDPRLRAGGGAGPATVGATIGAVVTTARQRDLTRDVAVLGGDTSSHALLALGVSELRVAEQFVPVGPVVATDDASTVAGCRVLLKGGQVGPVDILTRFADPT